jgi:hypothetical protein
MMNDAIRLYASARSYGGRGFRASPMRMRVAASFLTRPIALPHEFPNFRREDGISGIQTRVKL